MPKLSLIALLCALIIGAAALSAQTKLLRFPDIHDNRIVFTYGGDLWMVGATGGTLPRASRHILVSKSSRSSPLTASPSPSLSQYDGDEQVYVIPSGGGGAEPKQLTFLSSQSLLAPRWGYDNQVYGWSNDGQVRHLPLVARWLGICGLSRLYRGSPLRGGFAEAFAHARNRAPARIRRAATRSAHSPLARDFRTEKRYSGGQANELYIFDTETHEAKRRITEGPRASRLIPCGSARTFTSPPTATGHFNIYAYNTENGKTAQITRSTVWDVRWPSSDRQKRIVYELDGELQVLDVANGKSTPIQVSVPDDGINRRSSYVSAANLIEQYELSPKGERVLFSARGDIFSAPVEKGPTRNLTHSPAAHDKWPVWSPDGTKVAFISDASGEEEIWVVAQDGLSPAEQITTGGHAFRYDPKWSPDGKRIVFSDKDNRVWIVAVADKKLAEEVAHSKKTAAATTMNGLREAAISLSAWTTRTASPPCMSGVRGRQ